MVSARPARLGGWMFVAGVAFTGWFATLFWPSPVAAWVALPTVPIFRSLTALAVLTWPMGRLDPRWRRPVAVTLAAVAIVLMAAPFVGDLQASPPWGRPDWNLPHFGGHALGVLREAFVGVLVLGVAPTALLVAVGTRRRRLPRPLRQVAGPAYVAVWTMAIGDYWLLVSNVLARDLEQANGSTTLVGVTRTVVDYGRFGAVGVLLVVAARRRSAVLRVVAETGTVELGERLVSDALNPMDSIGLLFARPSGGWVTADGTMSDPPTSRAIALVDHGTTIAALEVGEHASPAAVEAAAAVVAVDLTRARRRAEATARLAELRALQREVLARQDGARSRLERDLHDGVQQQLVALRMQLALTARAPSASPVTAAPDAMAAAAVPDAMAAAAVPDAIAAADALDAVADDVDRLVNGVRLAVLDHGLAPALKTLAATCPIPCSVRCRGDLPPDDPDASRLWLAANDAVANALKHAAATRLDLWLDVRGSAVELAVADDGRGGLHEVPSSLIARMGTAGRAELAEKPGGGTTLVFVVERGQGDPR